MSSALITPAQPNTFGGMIDETRYIPPHFEEEVTAQTSVTIDGSKATTALLKMSCGTGGATGNVWFQKAAQDGKFTIENNYARSTTTGVETTTPQLSLKYDGTNVGMCLNGVLAPVQNASATDATTSTLTGAQIRSGLITATATSTLTLPTIAQVFPATLFSNVVVGQSVEFSVCNNGDTGAVITMAPSADITNAVTHSFKVTITAFDGAATRVNHVQTGRYKVVVTAATAGVPTAATIFSR